MGNRAIDVALKAAEFQQEKESNSKFSARMAASVKDIGQVDTMRHTILTYVAAEHYDRAIDELNNYVNQKSEYKQFKARAGRYVAYALDLINAVKAKRSFPGWQYLASSKQQELFDKAMNHFEDLKLTLRKIEQIDREIKVADVRSTVLVLKVLVYCVFALLLCGFFVELSRGIYPTANKVWENLLERMTNYLLALIGL